MRPATAGIVGTRDCVTLVLELMVFGTMIKERLDAAQTRHVVNGGLGTAQAGFVAQPRGGQLPRQLALTTSTPFALRTHY